MFERYTESARRMLFFSRYESSRLGAPVIETEHLLLGLLREPQGLAARVLDLAQVTPQQIREEIEAEVLSRPQIPTSVEIPFAADAMRVLQAAAEEADRLSHGYIGTEHLLLAILREEDSVAGRVLKRHGLTLDAARKTVADLSGEGVDDGSIPPTVNVDELIDGVANLARQLAASRPGSEETMVIVTQIDVKLAALRRLFGR